MTAGMAGMSLGGGAGVGMTTGMPSYQAGISSHSNTSTNWAASQQTGQTLSTNLWQ